MSAQSWRVVSKIFLILMLIIVGVIWFPSTYFFLRPKEPESSGLFPQEPVWVFRAAERITTSPVVQDQWVIIRTSQGIYWLDSTTGRPLLRVELAGSDRLPVPCDGLLLVPEGRHSLSTFTLSTGALVWTARPLPTYRGYVPTDVPVESMACGGEVTYVARYNWRLTAYKLLNGEILWESSVPDRSGLSLATDGHIVYLGANVYIQAYDGHSGERLWSERMGTFVRSIQLVANTLYIGLFEGPFLAMDVNSRAIRWQADFPAGEHPFLVEGDTLYITNQGNLAAILRENGRIIWQRKLPSADLGRPIVAKGVLYVRSARGYLYALEASTGRELGELKIQPDTPFVYTLDRSPSVAGDFLLVPFGDNRLLAYRLINLDTPVNRGK